ncbi:MAG TPA: serine protease [Azospirillum sp.]|nr:serine protease [Azospirillum sp.]
MRLPILAVLLLAACAGGDIPPVVAVRPVPTGSTEPLRFKELNTGLMRRGMEIGRYIWSLDCVPPYDRVFWKSGEGYRRYNTFHERFAETMRDAGFDVAGKGYDEGEDRQRARYTVTGELREVRLELCRRIHWLFGLDKGLSGTGTVKIDWIVYALGEQRVVHRTTTTGHAVLDSGVPEGDALLLEEGFSSAVSALAADPGFRAAVAHGHPPAMGGASAGSVPLLPPSAPARSMALSVTGAAPFRGVPEDNAERIADALVQVGRGRGVVVGQVDGNAVILAPAAPGDTVTVRAGRVALEGTVERRDHATGLMLVRVPARLDALPVRTAMLEVSEPVHVTIEGAAFSSGIVAGLMGGIQADLTGPAPEPGDPLLDSSGNLVGLALRGRVRSGLASFVPIGEALAALGVEAAGAKPRLDAGGRPPT